MSSHGWDASHGGEDSRLVRHSVSIYKVKEKKKSLRETEKKKKKKKKLEGEQGVSHWN